MPGLSQEVGIERTPPEFLKLYPIQPSIAELGIGGTRYMENPAIGVNWLTPALGTGARPSRVMSPDFARTALRKMRAWAVAIEDKDIRDDDLACRIREDHSLDDWDPGRTPLWQLLPLFVEGLVLDRLNSTPDADPRGAAEDIDVDLNDGAEDFHVDLLGLTALLSLRLTRIRAYALAELPDPPTRLRGGVHLLSHPDTHRTHMWEHLSRADQIIFKLSSLIRLVQQKASAGAEETPWLTTFAKFLEKLHAEIAEGRLNEHYEQILAEYLWFMLWSKHVAENPAYLGWKDLLRAIAIRHEQEPFEGSPELSDLALPVAEAVKDVYTALGLHTAPGVAENALADAAAEVLIAQGKLRARASEPTAVPVPTAVVTSFDMELEVALTKAESPFILVVPVRAKLEHGPMSKPLWLWARISPSERPEESSTEKLWAACKAAKNRWEILHGNATEGTLGDQFEREVRTPAGKALSDPVIVRLVGAPLVPIPSNTDKARHPGLFDGPRRLPHIADSDRVILRHSLVLGEKAALEFTDVDVVDGMGLPGFLFGHDRYWAMFGVQLSDPAIRHRVAVVSTLVRRKAQREDPMRGFTVNRRLDRRDADYIRTLGWDYVRGDVSTFVGQLRAYAKALEEHGQPEMITIPSLPGYDMQTGVHQSGPRLYGNQVDRFLREAGAENLTFIRVGAGAGAAPEIEPDEAAWAEVLRVKPTPGSSQRADDPIEIEVRGGH